MFTGCTGFATTNSYPDGTTGAQQDPEWEDPEPDPLRAFEIRLYDCAEVSIGPFNRPLRLIIESHTFQNPPESCYPTSSSSGLVFWGTLSSVWVNDKEVADWLKASYGMPTYFSEIKEVQTPQPGFLERAWSWGLAGQERSELKVIHDDLPTDPWPEGWRLYWFNETGVKFLDLVLEIEYPSFTNRYAWGTLAPPMLGANFNENYAANAFWLSRFEADGEVRLFNDHFCTEPA